MSIKEELEDALELIGHSIGPPTCLYILQLTPLEKELRKNFSVLDREIDMLSPRIDVILNAEHNMQQLLENYKGSHETFFRSILYNFEKIERQILIKHSYQKNGN